MAAVRRARSDSRCVAEGEEDCHSDTVRADDNERSGEANLQAELQMFRAQWMFELTPGVSSTALEARSYRASARGPSIKAVDTKGKLELAKEEKTLPLFLAIKFYRLAMQLVPDIEFKITYTRSPDSDGMGKSYIENNEDDSKMADLLSYFQQQFTFQESSIKLCQPELDVNQTHISVLPMELLMYIFRWVVSSDLDLRSLEQLSLVCRGFYICARSTGETAVSSFDIDKMYTPLFFARVKSFTAFSERPL
ncbi:hypothetical protein lerEdw1_001400 [Lerista edwardsae]|nr:hypothetical protein lerEdw1_001400 [Lerista edwardsae]